MRAAILALGLLVLTFIAYIPALSAGRVLDDNELLFENPAVRDDGGLARIWQFTPEIIDPYPIAWTSYWLEWRAFGEHERGYHVVSVLLHAAAAVLLWRLLAALQLPGAWLAAAVFAVHPVAVSTGAWIAERRTGLAMLFGLLCLLAYLRYERRREGSKTRLKPEASILLRYSKLPCEV